MRLPALLLALTLAGLCAALAMLSLLGWLDARELDEADGVLPGIAAHVAARLR